MLSKDARAAPVPAAGLERGRSACRGRGISNGRCGAANPLPMKPTSWSAAISSMAPPSSRPRSPRLCRRGQGTSWRTSMRWAAPRHGRRARLPEAGAGGIEHPPGRGDRAPARTPVIGVGVFTGSCAFAAHRRRPAAVLSSRIATSRGRSGRAAQRMARESATTAAVTRGSEGNSRAPRREGRSVMPALGGMRQGGRHHRPNGAIRLAPTCLRRVSRAALASARRRRGEVERLRDFRGRRRPVVAQGSAGALTFLVGKPGLDGHSSGAEQIARERRAERRHGGGLRRHPPDAGADRRGGPCAGHAADGTSILSGSHVPRW